MANYTLQLPGADIDARLAAVPNKQDTLVSGTNIKTVGGQSILGSGNIPVGDENAVKFTSQTLTSSQQLQARENIGAASLADINSADYVTATTLPTASASTMGHIYLIGPDANDNYERYITQQSGSSYSWVPIGSTALDLESITTSDIDALFA